MSLGTDKQKHLKIVVPLMLFASSLIMALAWLGHLRFKEFPFAVAMLASWLLVLPEYFLNIYAIRKGIVVFTGAQMAAFNLSSGVICVALVSRFVLGEELTPRKLAGFGLMIVAMSLISLKQRAVPLAPTDSVVFESDGDDPDADPQQGLEPEAKAAGGYS